MTPRSRPFPSLYLLMLVLSFYDLVLFLRRPIEAAPTIVVKRGGQEIYDLAETYSRRLAGAEREIRGEERKAADLEAQNTRAVDDETSEKL